MGEQVDEEPAVVVDAPPEEQDLNLDVTRTLMSLSRFACDVEEEEEEND